MGVSSHILVLGGACVIKLYVGVGHGRRWQGMHYLGTAIGTWNTQPQPFTMATLSSFSTKHSQSIRIIQITAATVESPSLHLKLHNQAINHGRGGGAV